MAGTTKSWNDDCGMANKLEIGEFRSMLHWLALNWITVCIKLNLLLMNELSLVFSFIPAISFVRDNLKCEETDNNEHSSHKEEWTNESSKFIKGDSKNGPNNKANTDTAFYVANNRSLSISIQNRSKRVASGLDGR